MVAIAPLRVVQELVVTEEVVQLVLLAMVALLHNQLPQVEHLAELEVLVTLVLIQLLLQEMAQVVEHFSLAALDLQEGKVPRMEEVAAVAEEEVKR